MKKRIRKKIEQLNRLLEKQKALELRLGLNLNKEKESEAVAVIEEHVEKPSAPAQDPRHNLRHSISCKG